MSAHRIADKYPVCIQYTAQHVRHDTSQLHKELYTQKKTSGTFRETYITQSRDCSTVSLSVDERSKKAKFSPPYSPPHHRSSGLIFTFVKPLQISCFNFIGIKIANFLCRFLFPLAFHFYQAT